MVTAELHRCEVIATPWPGVHVTRIESSRHFPKHWHDTFGVGLIDDGAHRSASGHGAVQAFAGDLISTNPGEVHDGRPLGVSVRRWRMVYMDAAALQASTLASGEPAGAELSLTRPVFDDPCLRQALERVFALLRHGMPAAERLACDEAWSAVCGQLITRHASAPNVVTTQAAPGLHRVRDRLADDPVQAPTLAELADIAGLSRYQVLRHFSAAYGVPPHAWLRQQRVLRARRLIAQGLPLADAAAACGFADQSHMTRSFVQQFGFTPGAWRQAALQ